MCSVCGKSGRVIRGWCSTCYERWRRTGDPRTPDRRRCKPLRECALEECHRKHEGLGYCRIHYRRFRKAGSPHLVARQIPVCTVEDCDVRAHARGLCNKHYDRWSRLGTTELRTLEERLWAKVVRLGPEACWPWTGATLKGYGQIGDGGKVLYAHRVAWEVTNGAVAGGLHVLHRCDNPPCCNPSHLFLGTHQDNMNDMMSKGRGAWQKRVTT